MFPQVLPTYLSHCLYSFEMNVRAASILGYVGAGGLGIRLTSASAGAITTVWARCC
ncbi:MAG: PhnE/PtxC family ABC transporter permease [Christensenellales bacterium]